ncbi:MAG: hypothetical protein JO370_14525 [Paucibacter sp.]|nr:hypothetical protein [Roseateles sp.]
MDDKEVPIEVRKERLIREGELYRVGVVHAKARVSQALRPDAVLHEAFEQVVGMAQARFSGLLQPGGLSGLKLSSLLPYALTVASYVARKRLIKPALAVGVVVAVGAAWLIRRKRD